LELKTNINVLLNISLTHKTDFVRNCIYPSTPIKQNNLVVLGPGCHLPQKGAKLTTGLQQNGENLKSTALYLRKKRIRRCRRRQSQAGNEENLALNSLIVLAFKALQMQRKESILEGRPHQRLNCSYLQALDRLLHFLQTCFHRREVLTTC
jgi:hypothetical protein